MTAPSSPVTLVYGSPEYDERVRMARLPPQTLEDRALLAADERARAMEEVANRYLDQAMKRQARAEAAEARCAESFRAGIEAAAKRLDEHGSFGHAAIVRALTPPAPESDKPEPIETLRALCRRAPLFMNELDAAGLHASARLMDAVVKRIGYEAAEKVGKP